MVVSRDRQLTADNRRREGGKYLRHVTDLPDEWKGRMVITGVRIQTVVWDGVVIGTIAVSGAAVRATPPDGAAIRKFSRIAAARYLLELHEKQHG